VLGIIVSSEKNVREDGGEGFPREMKDWRKGPSGVSGRNGRGKGVFGFATAIAGSGVATVRPSVSKL
jgi:hypothetical protein